MIEIEIIHSSICNHCSDRKPSGYLDNIKEDRIIDMYATFTRLQTL